MKYMGSIMRYSDAPILDVQLSKNPVYMIIPFCVVQLFFFFFLARVFEKFESPKVDAEEEMRRK